MNTFKKCVHFIAETVKTYACYTTEMLVYSTVCKKL
jgi:hypothetical protein